MALVTFIHRLLTSRKKERRCKGDKPDSQLSEWFSSPDLLNPEDQTRPSAAILNFYSSEYTGRPVSMFITSDVPYFSHEELSSSAISTSMDDLCERSYSHDSLHSPEKDPSTKARASRFIKKMASPFSKKSARPPSTVLTKSQSTPMLADSDEQKVPRNLKRHSSIMQRSWEMSRHRRSTLASRRAKRLSMDSQGGSSGGSFSCDESDPFPSPTSKSPPCASEKKHTRISSSGSQGKPPSPLAKTYELRCSSDVRQGKAASPGDERRVAGSPSATRSMRGLHITPEDPFLASQDSPPPPRGRRSPRGFAMRDLSHSPATRRKKTPSPVSENDSSPASRSWETRRREQGSSFPRRDNGSSSSSSSSSIDSSESEEDPPSSVSHDVRLRAPGNKVGRNVSAAEKSWQHRRKEKIFLKSRRSRASGELPYNEALIN